MKIIGIYKIQSKINSDRIYIGSTVNMRSRWGLHLSRLNRNVHDNPKLQAHFNKYGIEDLEFSVLKKCTRDNLIESEQYFIDLLDPWFNILKTAYSRVGHKASKETKVKMSIAQKKRHQLNPRSKETLLKMSKTHTGKKMSKEARKKMSDHWSIPISQFDKNGNLIRHWDSASQAREKLKIFNIDRVANGLRASAGGFIWKYRKTA